MVPEDMAPEESGKVCEGEPEADGLLQPLWAAGQLRKPERILPSIAADTLQVVESTKPEKELYLGRLQRVTQLLQRTAPTDYRQTTSQGPWHDDYGCLRRKRVRLKSPVRENRTPGSVRGALGNRCPYRELRCFSRQAVNAPLSPLSSFASGSEVCPTSPLARLTPSEPNWQTAIRQSPPANT